MDKIARIRQEIERRINELDRDKYINIDAKACRVSELSSLKRFIDTLSEEPDKGLEEASYDAVCRIFGCDPMYFGNKAEITARECDYLFRAGVEWRDSQLHKLPDKSLEEEISRTYHDGSVTDTEDIDHVAYENIARHFAEWQKSQMLKDAVECELYWDGDFLAIDLDMAALGCSERDKVKVIVLKAEEE